MASTSQELGTGSKTMGNSKKSVAGDPKKSLAAKMTGAIHLDTEIEDRNYAGRMLVLDSDKNEMGRVDLPPQFRQGHREPAPWDPQAFKDYLSETLGFAVQDVYYKVRDHKKGVLVIRYAKLGETDVAEKWPFVAGMKLYVHGEGMAGPPSLLQKSPSQSLSQASTADSSTKGGSECSIM